MSGLFQGQTLVVYSADPIAAPKAAVDFSKSNDKLVILGGAMGPTSLDEGGVKALASLPSLDELRAKIVGMISTPANPDRTGCQRASRPACSRRRSIFPEG